METMRKIAAFSFALALGVSTLAWAGGIMWYNFYETGQGFMKRGDYDRALMAFQSAASMEFKDNKQARTYGMNFMEYFPHREMGVCYYNLGDLANARRELDLSQAFARSGRAQEYLSKVGSGVVPMPQVDPREQARLEAEKQRIAEEQARLEKQRQELASLQEQKRIVEEQRLKEREEKLRKEKEQHDREVTTLLFKGPEKVSKDQLKYDLTQVTIVGERMSVAVLPFETHGGATDLGQTMLDKLITQLVNLHRFKVIERSQLDKVLKQQALGQSGVVDEKTATAVGHVLGADAVLIGSITQDEKKISMDARLVDTETGEVLTSKDAYGKAADPEELRKMATRIAVDVYNAMPLAQGTVIKVETSEFMVDLGEDKGLKKGMKVVVFKEGEEIKHPVTGELLGRKTTKLGEIILKDVQTKFGTGEAVGEKEGTIEVGDKVIVK
jgi:TolB-like protein